MDLTKKKDSVFLDNINYDNILCNSKFNFDLKFFNKNISLLEKKLLNLKYISRDNLMRIKAEIENIRKRTILEINNSYKFSFEKFILDLLPVIDNLERAIFLMVDKKLDFDKILIGLELTLKSFLDVITKYGVHIINDINIPFDPSVHQAISVVKNNKFKYNYIIMVMQKGYMLHNRLLRPAMVVVSNLIN